VALRLFADVQIAEDQLLFGAALLCDQVHKELLPPGTATVQAHLEDGPLRRFTR
jgi:hypothetical protein